jgi:hypothetical protein
MIAKNPLQAKSIQRPASEKKQALARTGAIVGPLQAMGMLVASCGHRQGELFAVAREDLNQRREPPSALFLEICLSRPAGDGDTRPVVAWSPWLSGSGRSMLHKRPRSLRANATSAASADAFAASRWTGSGPSVVDLRRMPG